MARPQPNACDQRVTFLERGNRKKAPRLVVVLSLFKLGPPYLRGKGTSKGFSTGSTPPTGAEVSPTSCSFSKRLEVAERPFAADPAYEQSPETLSAFVADA